MKKGLFEFIITSAHDREKLTCEICIDNELVAEITQETEVILLEIYPPRANQYWVFPLDEFKEALDFGKRYLIDGSIQH